MMGDFLKYGKQGERAIVRRPDACDETCIHFHNCGFPKSCAILQKTLRNEAAAKRERS